MRKYRKANPEKFKSYDLKKQYGIDVVAYDAMLEQQEGKCAICGLPPQKHRLAVDHCHVSGEVRELLCTECNTGLGRFKDDAEMLQRAVDYIRKHERRRTAVINLKAV